MAEKPTATASEVEQTRAAADAEWGTYVATQPISFNGVTAYNVGDPVPVSNVDRHGYLDQGLVAKAGLKAGQEAILSTLTQPAEAEPRVSLAVPINN